MTYKPPQLETLASNLAYHAMKVEEADAEYQVAYKNRSDAIGLFVSAEVDFEEAMKLLRGRFREVTQVQSAP